MKALVLPEEYYKREVFEKENAKIFSKCWSFVGFLNQFENVNDFVTTTISGVPIVVQNLKGEIRAFKNICSHRHSIIQIEKSGNRSLTCPYHGWAYNNKGIPFGIPKKPFFGLDKQEIECLKLKSYHIEVCGSLVFVNINDEPETLKSFLGTFYDQVEEMSNSFGKLIDVNEITIKCNWKIVVENTLESYHVALVHENSLYKLGPQGMDFEFDKNHSLWRASLNKKENEGKQAKVHKPYQNRQYKIEGYEHLAIFPNILISSTYGVSFNLSHIIPIDEETTKFISYVFITKKNENKSSVIEEIFEKMLIDFNRQVFQEDKEITEEVQKGVKFAHHSGELSEEEERVTYFQKNYKKYLIE